MYGNTISTLITEPLQSSVHPEVTGELQSKRKNMMFTPL